jgi:TolB protein
MMTMKKIILLWVSLLFTTSLWADIDLVIDKSGDDAAIPIIIAPFQGGAPAPHLVGIMKADLKRSGRFTLIDPAKAGPLSPMGGSLNPAVIQKSGAEYIIRGKIQPSGKGRFDLLIEIINTENGKGMAGYRMPFHPNQRRMAHKAADAIFKRLTGINGAFDTRIAYVAAEGVGETRMYRLIVADADGHQPEAIVRSREPIMSVSWSPNNREIAYVSFESGRPSIYVQNLATGDRRLISSRKGINGAPSWSRDGRKIAVSLSLEGNPEIYTIDLGSGTLTRVTHSRAIDTEPSWDASGRNLIFTSDRGGRPQLYRIPVTGGKAQRITFVGNYNSDASVVGNKAALVRRQGGKFRIAIMDLSSHEADIISRGSLDESPSLAPNGAMVIYETRTKSKRGALGVVSDNGRSRQILYSPYKDVRHPAWSSYLR